MAFAAESPPAQGQLLLLLSIHTLSVLSVLATEETMVTQKVSHRPIKCQSRLWSQRGTKVNGSHHGDNPLLRPTGIRIATKSYATLQAMAPTNIKTVHQTFLLYIESSLDRLGLLSPTHGQRSQQQSGQITLQPVDQRVRVSQGHTSYRNKQNWNTEVHGGGVPEKAPRILPVHRSL